MTPRCRNLTALFFAGLLLAPAARVAAQTPLFFEDFDNLPLGPSVDEFFFEEAFTKTLPFGWDRFDDVPGITNPDLGVEEWEGWSLADLGFWREAGLADKAPELRLQFDRGAGTIAVADPDQWDALGRPANSPNGGFYNSIIRTPDIGLADAIARGERVKLGFDSTWFGGDCCDDGRGFDPPNQPAPFSNNQTAVVRATYQDGTVETLLRWEAAPFIDSLGNPSAEPGPNTIPNPNFKPPNPNERVWLELTIPQAAALTSGSFAAISGGGGAGESASIEFGMGNAGDDGWWGVDNVEMFSISTVLGDMNINGVVDAGDVAAFAIGLLDANEYRNTYYGEFPVTRGSNDSTFDFDDIEWFVGILEGEGVAASVSQVIALLNPVPEPATAATMICCIAFGLSGRRNLAG